MVLYHVFSSFARDFSNFSMGKRTNFGRREEDFSTGAVKPRFGGLREARGIMIKPAESVKLLMEFVETAGFLMKQTLRPSSLCELVEFARSATAVPTLSHSARRTSVFVGRDIALRGRRHGEVC
ncbi:MAG: hypothetical protein IKQ92_02750 [Clostridia bacterium]|nr:hypothetical protein [Clostridia bacterium]